MRHCPARIADDLRERVRPCSRLLPSIISARPFSGMYMRRTRDRDPALADVRRRAPTRSAEREHFDGLRRGLFDGAQRCIARRVDAELDGQHGRTLDFHLVQQAALEFAPENARCARRACS